jgi:glutaredoxin
MDNRSIEVKVFGKPGCEYCKTTVKKFETFLGRWNIPSEKVALNFYDMETVDGLAEGAFNSVIKIPTTIIKDQSSLLARWDGQVPLSKDFENFFKDMKPESEKDIN